MELTETLQFQGLTFYFINVDVKRHVRVYKSLDELVHHTILTPVADYDGALIGSIPEAFREDEDDDMIRYFDSQTGIEEL